MAIQPFLAMTAAEIQNLTPLPPKIAWMACHFSASGTGLSNLPGDLPPGSLLILDDSTPICGHDPEQIGNQLGSLIDAFQCTGILLDFQRPGNPEAAALAEYLTNVFPCPIALSEPYAKDMTIPVFLSPVPPSVPIKDHISFWSGRDIWLDISPNPELLRLTPTGCESTFLPPRAQIPEASLADTDLHCHYHIRTAEDVAEFTLWRTKEDLENLCQEAQALGVTGVVGLYQELGLWEKG